MTMLPLKLGRLKKLGSLALIAALLLSCKKEISPIKSWSGNITSTDAGKAIPNVEVKVKASKVQSGSYNAGLNQIGNTTSDNNGFYQFEFERAVYGNFTISATHPNYFFWKEEISSQFVSNTEEFKHDLVLTPKSVIKLNISHINTNQAPVKFVFRTSNETVDCEECCKNENLRFEVDSLDFTKICLMEGNIDYQYHYTTNIDGQVDTTFGSIRTITGDTTHISIQY